ncbi:heme peroxidase [Laetiporus sulphureus 93-53]|uniref:Heme peroxidase n=1 Tax=Laetiporus sulphureus 93-53 TaxID=1314785 RepID=A0A165EAI8_9APHY|nr:heme peroxidase [Laetiporus sulphureus 93-53]KZT06596.1 heme peroxidase [Laetiporus sulphureus 93-53]
MKTNAILSPRKDTDDYIVGVNAPFDPYGVRSADRSLTRSVRDVVQNLMRFRFFSLADIRAILNVAQNILGHGPGIDDRLYFLERLLIFIARSPDNFAIARNLQLDVINILFKDLQSPPVNFLAIPSVVPSPIEFVNYAYRTADGSNYNVLMPTLGMAGSPYVRSVPGTTPIPQHHLPEPELVFNMLLRRDGFVEHPGGLSSLFFSFANLIIHSIFHTNPRDWTINDASSYLDLSPLYGSNQEQVDSVRRKDGTGRLWEDVFADARLLLMPPSTGALLVLFCRNHNYVAERIRAINEFRTYADPATLDEKGRAAQDDEIFQRARLVNTAFFMQVILGDYVGAILGLTRDGLTWRLDPLQAMREPTHEWIPRGDGNVVSIEFNLMYRWHMAISKEDRDWTDDLFHQMFPGMDFDQITVEDFWKAVREYRERLPTDLREWTFSGLQRDASGRYNDADLAHILQSATEAPAGAFRARGIPEALRVVEILGILQARSWGTCSLNEFRSFMGLRPYRSFKEWNPDPKVYMAAEKLYHNIDNLELYVGMQAEETKVPMPGAGLCPGFTMSRAILADAVCLTRGDRFLTVDLTPFNLTTWGFQDVQVNGLDGSCGGILSRLLIRTLPACYSASSAYTLFPFMVPKRMKEYVTKWPGSPVDQYLWTRQESLTNGIRKELGVEKMAQRILGVLPDRQSVHKALYEPGALERHAASFGKITRSLIVAKSVVHANLAMRYVNVVKDVVNLIPVYWIAKYATGIPMKTEANPQGFFGEQELVHMFADVASYLSPDINTSEEFELREKYLKIAQVVTDVVKFHLSQFESGSPLGTPGRAADHYEHDRKFLTALRASGKHAGYDALAAGVFVEIVASAAPYSRALAHVVDYFLEEGEREELVRWLAAGKEGEAQVEEGIFRALGSDQTNGVPKSNGISHSALLLNKQGLVKPIFFVKTAAEVLRAIFALDGLRRVPGVKGILNQLSDSMDGRQEHFYLDTEGKVTEWPVSMTVQYIVH